LWFPFSRRQGPRALWLARLQWCGGCGLAVGCPVRRQPPRSQSARPGRRSVGGSSACSGVPHGVHDESLPCSCQRCGSPVNDINCASSRACRELVTNGRRWSWWPGRLLPVLCRVGAFPPGWCDTRRGRGGQQLLGWTTAVNARSWRPGAAGHARRTWSSSPLHRCSPARCGQHGSDDFLRRCLRSLLPPVIPGGRRKSRQGGRFRSSFPKVPAAAEMLG